MNLSLSNYSQNLSDTPNKFTDQSDYRYDSGQKRIHDIVNKYAPESVISDREPDKFYFQQSSKKAENNRPLSSLPLSSSEDYIYQYAPPDRYNYQNSSEAARNNERNRMYIDRKNLTQLT